VGREGVGRGKVFTNGIRTGRRGGGN